MAVATRMPDSKSGGEHLSNSMFVQIANEMKRNTILRDLYIGLGENDVMKVRSIVQDAIKNNLRDDVIPQALEYAVTNDCTLTIIKVLFEDGKATANSILVELAISRDVKDYLSQKLNETEQST